MTTLVIKSNQGNHSGYNVKWQLIGSYNSMPEAKEELVKQSLNLSDNHVWRNGRAYDPDNKEYIYTNKQTSFTYDGYTYMIVGKNDLDLFNGGAYGYLPDSIINEF